MLFLLLSPFTEPGWHSAPAMKLLNVAGFFALVPTLVPALEPITTSLAFSGAAVMWQLFSPASWLKCRFWECCNMKDTLDIPGNGSSKQILWAEESMGPADLRGAIAFGVRGF